MKKSIEVAFKNGAIIFVSSALAVGLGTFIHNMDKETDFAPFSPKDNADAIAETYRVSNGDRSYKINPDFMKTLVESTKGWDAPVAVSGNPHNFVVVTGYVEGTPAMALYENGKPVGTAEAWQKDSKGHSPDAIYAAVQPSSSKTKSQAAKYER